MNQDLPMNIEQPEEKGTITYATEVIATIVGVATTEVEGIASMSGSASISELLSGRPKNQSRGVRVEVGAEEVAVDVSVIVDYGMPIQTVGRNVQENIRKSIETMTGLHVIKVDVHVMGVSFEKENKELEQGQEVARLQSGQNGSSFGSMPQEEASAPSPKHKNKSHAKKEEAAEKPSEAVEVELEPTPDAILEEVAVVAPEETSVEVMEADLLVPVSLPNDDPIEYAEAATDATQDAAPAQADMPSEGKARGGRKPKKVTVSKGKASNNNPKG